MAIDFGNSINMNNMQILNFVVHSSVDSPAFPVAGQMWFKSDNSLLQIFSNGSWNRLIQGGESSVIGNIPVWNSINADRLGAGLSVTSIIGNPLDNLSIPTERAVRLAISEALASEMTFRGGYDVAANVPNLDGVSPIVVSIGDTYVATSEGLFFNANVKAGDIIISRANNATLITDWVVINRPIEKTFIQLPDTPSTYIGNSLRLTRVNATETGLEFVSSGDLNFMTLDTPQNVLAAKTFVSGGLILNNPTNTFRYSFIGNAITVNRNVSLPLLTDNDTFVFENHSQTLRNKTINASENTITGFIGGGGTTNFVPKFINVNTLGNSLISDDGATVTIGGTLVNVANRLRMTQFQLGTSAVAGHVLTADAAGVGTYQAISALPPATAGQTLMHNGTAWVANSALFNDGTNIGIGTVLPLARLDVNGAGRFNELWINNPTQTARYIITPSSITANRNINLPLLTADDTFVFANHAATLLNKTINAANNTIIGLEPTIAAGTTAQYFRGDKTWQTLNTAAVVESTNLYFTNARAQAAITLTTTGSSGAATFIAGVLNIPNYTVSGLTWPLLSTVDGTAAAPAYSWSGNTNMGIRRAGVNELSFVTAGIDRMTINATGNVILNTPATEQNHALSAGRNIWAGTGLTGGGNLTSDRTLSLTGQALQVHNLSVDGILIRHWDEGIISRTLTGTANQIIITNADGIAGNIGFALPQNIHSGASPTFAGGLFNGTVEFRGSIRTRYALEFQHHEPTWGVNATRPYIVKSFGTGIGDFMYLGSTGNGTNTAQSAMVLGSTGIRFGRGQDSPSGELTTEWMRISDTGNMGIGIVPTTRLDVAGVARVNELRINNPALTFQNIIQSSAIAANRTMTLPLLTGNDTFVFQAHIQTLTNKTIVAASNTISDTSQAVGDILRNNGTRFVRFAMGTSRQVLTTNVAGTDIAWGFPTIFSLEEIPATNLTATGIRVMMTAGETIAIGQLVTFGIDGNVYLCSSTGINRNIPIGIALSAGVSLSAITVLTYGIMRNDAWSLSSGQRIFNSETPGNMGTIEPTGIGQIVGISLHPRRILFNPIYRI